MKYPSSIQPTFDFTGDQLAIAGMEQAKENADRKVKGWSDDCWFLFLEWLKEKPRYSEFMLEEFRNHCKGLIEDPPDQRAYAFLTKRASKEGWIGHAGVSRTKNKVSHSRPGNVWFKK